MSTDITSALFNSGAIIYSFIDEMSENRDHAQHGHDQANEEK